MPDIIFKTRTLAKYLDVQVRLGGTSVDLGPLNANEAESLLAEVDSLREDLSAYLEIARPTSGGDFNHD